MRRCHNCKRPIMLLHSEPTRWNPAPKAHPIDPEPNSAGNLALYERPDRLPGTRPEDDQRERRTYYRKVGGFVRTFLINGRYKLYISHFDTCPARR